MLRSVELQVYLSEMESMLGALKPDNTCQKQLHVLGQKRTIGGLPESI